MLGFVTLRKIISSQHLSARLMFHSLKIAEPVSESAQEPVVCQLNGPESPAIHGGVMLA
jgi:hypothetical protein